MSLLGDRRIAELKYGPVLVETEKPSVRCKPPLERVIQKEILAYLTSKGYFVWRQNAGAIPTGNGGFRAFNGMRGLPDICGLLPQRPFVLAELADPRYSNGDWIPQQALFVEVKRPGGKLRPEQAAFIDKANELGHLAFMATCLDDVKARGL